MARWPIAVLSLALSTAGMAFQQTPPPKALAAAGEKLKTGDLPEAARILAADIKANPQAIVAEYVLLEECYLRLQDIQNAQTTLQSALRVHPTSPILDRALGELLFHLKYDSSEAGTHLARAAKLLPRDPEAKHYYAQWAYLNARDRICAQQEKDALALPGLNEVALLQMYTLLGMCESRLEEEPEARSAFEHAQEVNARAPNYDPVSALTYVQFLTRYNDDSTAAKVVDGILQRIPEFGPAHLEKAKQYDRAGDLAHAVSEARLALTSAGIDANIERAAHSLIARCLRSLGDTEGSAREQEWIDAHPNPETPRGA